MFMSRMILISQKSGLSCDSFEVYSSTVSSWEVNGPFEPIVELKKK